MSFNRNQRSMSPPVTSPASTPSQGQMGTATLRIRSKARRSGNLLLEMPIGARLTLGFILAALIATIAASLIGFLRSEALSRQSNFYQKLLQTNTSLTTGANFLQLMNTETHTLLDDASVPQPSVETLNLDRNAIQSLTTRYNDILNAYIGQDLVSKHADDMALLAEGGNAGQADQQVTLAGSALRSWQVYHAAQNLIVLDMSQGNLAQVQRFMRVQVEPTNADALSALRALIQFDQRLAASVQDAAAAEVQSQLLTTIGGIIIAFITIVLVGWFISSTIIRRLRQLRHVTQSVEQGQLDARVAVIGRDEIADVSASVNAMLEAIVGLLDETRHQRDVLTNAAEHLFFDMRVVSAGDLRVNAPVSNDPIGMLANAFNFTVGRFRRFVLRLQTIVEQLEVLSRQEQERAESFRMRLLKTGAAAPTQVNPDMIRQGIGFANEVNVVAHHVAELAQEMRTGIVSFQFDNHDANMSNANPSQPLQAPVNYKLSAGGAPEPGTSVSTMRHHSRNLP